MLISAQLKYALLLDVGVMLSVMLECCWGFVGVMLECYWGDVGVLLG